jgi:alpha-tubulin suppressor-like RCC1 family protein
MVITTKEYTANDTFTAPGGVTKVFVTATFNSTVTEPLYNKISAGGLFGLATDMTNIGYTWGSNANGRLGTGDVTNRLTPTQVANQSNFTMISAGSDFAVIYNGQYYAWGNATNGKLGDNSIITKSTPSLITFSTPPLSIAGGSTHGAILTVDGIVFSWGAFTNGQLGTGDAISRSTPIQVPNQSNFKDISMGSFFSLALKSDGRVFSWGGGSSGQLGIGTDVSNRSTPVQVVNESDFIAISAGSGHSLALKSDGRVFSWGFNTSGQLGLGDVANRSTPAQVVNESGFKAIAKGANATFSLALKSDGRIFAWGINSSGQLGLGDTINRSTPTQVVNESDFAAIAIGFSQSLALKSDGRLFAWGASTNGQIGDGLNVSKSTPKEIYINPVVTPSNSSKVYTIDVVPNTSYNIAFSNGLMYFNSQLIGSGSKMVVWYAV